MEHQGKTWNALTLKEHMRAEINRWFIQSSESPEVSDVEEKRKTRACKQRERWKQYHGKPTTYEGNLTSF